MILLMYLDEMPWDFQQVVMPAFICACTPRYNFDLREQHLKRLVLEMKIEHMRAFVYARTCRFDLIVTSKFPPEAWTQYFGADLLENEIIV